MKYIKSNIAKEEELPSAIFFKAAIAENIYNQMKQHFVLHSMIM